MSFERLIEVGVPCLRVQASLPDAKLPASSVADRFADGYRRFSRSQRNVAVIELRNEISLHSFAVLKSFLISFINH